MTSLLSLYHLDNSLCDCTELSREAALFRVLLVSSTCISVCSTRLWSSLVCTCFATYHYPIVLDWRYNDREVGAFFVQCCTYLYLPFKALLIQKRNYKQGPRTIMKNTNSTTDKTQTQRSVFAWFFFYTKNGEYIVNIKLKTNISFHKSSWLVRHNFDPICYVPNACHITHQRWTETMTW